MAFFSSQSKECRHVRAPGLFGHRVDLVHHAAGDQVERRGGGFSVWHHRSHAGGPVGGQPVDVAMATPSALGQSRLAGLPGCGVAAVQQYVECLLGGAICELRADFGPVRAHAPVHRPVCACAAGRTEFHLPQAGGHGLGFCGTGLDIRPSGDTGSAGTVGYHGSLAGLADSFSGHGMGQTRGNAPASHDHEYRRSDVGSTAVPAHLAAQRGDLASADSRTCGGFHRLPRCGGLGVGSGSVLLRPATSEHRQHGAVDPDHTGDGPVAGALAKW